jgi:hypothetical protein
LPGCGVINRTNRPRRSRHHRGARLVAWRRWCKMADRLYSVVAGWAADVEVELIGRDAGPFGGHGSNRPLESRCDARASAATQSILPPMAAAGRVAVFVTDDGFS